MKKRSAVISFSDYFRILIFIPVERAKYSENFYAICFF